MKIHLILLTICLSACMFFMVGCGRDSSSFTPMETNLEHDPGILPYDTPTDSTPFKKAEDGDGDDPGGSEPGGGGPGSGNGQQPVPEPSTLVLVGSGIALITLCRKKKKAQEIE